MKKFIVVNAIVIIMSTVFLVGYTGALSIPVYADDVIDEWQNVTTNEQLVEAFRYYCKSRDLTIDGSVANAVTSFTTKTFNGLCNFLGIDVTALQADIKYRTDSNGGLQFLFNTTGISAYNRIFAQFLQDNDLSVGDSVNNEVVDSGIYYTGYDNFTSKLYVFDSEDFGGTSTNHTLTKGTPYKYDTSYYYNVAHSGSMQPSQDKTLSFNTTIDTYSVGGLYGNYGTIYFYTNGSYLNSSRNPCSGNAQASIILYRKNNDPQNRIRVGYYIISYGNNNVMGNRLDSLYYFTLEENLTPTNIYITTNNSVINNNNYEGDTIINNNGTPTDPNAPDPDNPTYNPYPGGGGSNTPSGTIGGNGTDGTINFPDLNINLPEINWSLGDLSNKFPFSIPFDMIAFLTLLNGEPQAPHITGSIPLTSHYTWELDLDFSQFDTFAGIMRGLEFVGFMFFLISATINIVRG